MTNSNNINNNNNYNNTLYSKSNIFRYTLISIIFIFISIIYSFSYYCINNTIVVNNDFFPQIDIQKIIIYKDSTEVNSQTPIFRTHRIYFKAIISNTGNVEISEKDLKEGLISIYNDNGYIATLDNVSESLQPGKTLEISSSKPWKATPGMHTFYPYIQKHFSFINMRNKMEYESPPVLNVLDISLQIEQGNEFKIKNTKTAKLNYIAYGANITEDMVEWKVSENNQYDNNPIISIDKKGNIKALKVGEQEVLAYIIDTEITAKIKIIVTERQCVIFIPGYLGSKLYYNNTRIWPPSAYEQFSSKKDLQSIQALVSELNILACSNDGTPINTVNISTEDLYGSYDAYKNIIVFLNNNQDFKDNFEKLYFYPWDWRNIEYGINNLDDFISKIPEEKIYIITHSTGGLLAAKYFSQQQNSRIASIITIAAPFLGTPAMYENMESGRVDVVYNKLNFLEAFAYDLTVKDTIKKLLANFKSSYQLIPGKQYFDAGNYFIENTLSKQRYNFFDTVSHIRSKFNSSLYEQSLDFQDKISFSIFDKIDYYNIVGCSEKTKGIFFEPLNIVSNPYNVNGDGLVPVMSATINLKSPKDKSFYVYRDCLGNINQLHGTLPNLECVQELVLNLLLGKKDSFDTSKISKEFMPSRFNPN